MKLKHFICLSTIGIITLYGVSTVKKAPFPEPITVPSEQVIENRVAEPKLEIIDMTKLEPATPIHTEPLYTEVMLEVSYYCPCEICSEEWGTMTADGGTAVEGVTIAMPPEVPFGTEVYIEALGSTFIVQDRGGYIKTLEDNTMRVDVYVNSHSRALELGRHMSVGRIYN